MTDRTKAEAALEYARRGWKVFPIRGGTKDAPLVKWGSECSDDQARVSQWWRENPDANIGLAVGASGLAVVDLDDKVDKKTGERRTGTKSWDLLEMEHGEAAPTLEHRTPSGGRHLIYKGEIRNSVDKAGSGIDTRGGGGFGGYILLPPSDVGGNRYEVIHDRPTAAPPEWLVAAVGARRETRNKDVTSAVELDQPHNVKWASEYLANDAVPAVSGHGGNNRAFAVACVLRDKGISEQTSVNLMLVHYNDRCQPPWSDEEIATFCKNAWNYGSVVVPGGDTAEHNFDPAGKAGPPPDLSNFWDQGARPIRAETAVGSSAEDPKSRGLLDEWVWIASLKMFMRRKDKFMLDAVSFDSLFGYMGDKGKIANQVLSQAKAIQKFHSLHFMPGHDEFDGELYNTWTKPPVEARQGDTAVFDEHMLRLLPDERERGMALDWMAWVVQNETLKPNFMFLMQGEQGCGKSWLGVLMSKLIGERNTTFLRTEDVGNRFNSWVMRTRLAVVEELMGDDKRTLANRMKALITQDTVTVEYKGKDLLTTPNKACFMAFTNHMDALRLENSDRRYMVFKTRAKGKDVPTEYFDALWAFVRSPEGPAAVLHSLLVREVPAGFGLGRAPHTKAHDEMRREGLPDVERWILEEHELGNPPFDADLVCATDVESAMPDRLRRFNGLHKLIPAFLRDELHAVPLGAHRLGGRGSRQVKLWAVRRGELYQQMTHAQRVERYLASRSAKPIQDFEDGTPDEVQGDDPFAT